MGNLETIYDVVVIGAGPGGLTAALYTSRANLNTLIIERGVPGGQMMNTGEIENYPGFDHITGPDLSTKMFEQATKFGAEYKYGDVKGITDTPDYKIVHTSKEDIKTKTIIIATGTTPRYLGVDGEDKFRGRGVSYCAICDGAFFKEKELIVVGGGDSAVEESQYLTKFANKVTVVHRRDAFRAQSVLQNRFFDNEKTDVIWDSTVEEIKGDDKVSTVVLKNVKTGEISNVNADGVFVYIGLIPLSEPFKIVKVQDENGNVVEEVQITNDKGYIPTDESMNTKVKGIYAIGDIREKDLRQIVTATGDGGIAAVSAQHYIENL